MRGLVVFDIDGVLVDSYKGIPIFYRQVLPGLPGFTRMDGEMLYRYELYAEGLGVLRIEWWPHVMPWLGSGEIKGLLDTYWRIRHGYSRLMPGAGKILERLRGLGFVLASVSYKDDIPGLKVKRIRDFGLHKHLEDILIVDDDIPSRLEGIHILMEKYGVDHAVYVDDKPGVLWKIKHMDNRITLVQYKFPFDEEFPWTGGYVADYIVHSMSELYHTVVNV